MALHRVRADRIAKKKVVRRPRQVWPLFLCWRASVTAGARSFGDRCACASAGNVPLTMPPGEAEAAEASVIATAAVAAVAVAAVRGSSCVVAASLTLQQVSTATAPTTLRAAGTRPAAGPAAGEV